jgi:hypothetical protein
LSYTQICKVFLFNQFFVLFLGAQIDLKVEKWKKSYKEEKRNINEYCFTHKYVFFFFLTLKDFIECFFFFFLDCPKWLVKSSGKDHKDEEERKEKKIYYTKIWNTIPIQYNICYTNTYTLPATGIY